MYQLHFVLLKLEFDYFEEDIFAVFPRSFIETGRVL